MGVDKRRALMYNVYNSDTAGFMKNIAIVEDEDEAAARLTGYIERYAEQNGQKYRVERFNNAVDFLAEYK